jgi:hypothetical protein
MSIVVFGWVGGKVVIPDRKVLKKDQRARPDKRTGKVFAGSPQPAPNI